MSRVHGRLIAGKNIFMFISPEHLSDYKVEADDCVFHGDITADNFIAFGSADIATDGDMFVPGTIYQVSYR